MLTWFNLGLVLVAGSSYSPSEAIAGWELSKSAYCPRGLETWDCPTCHKTGLSLTQVKVIEHKNNRAVVAYDPKKSHIIVIFRGTNNHHNLVQDMDMSWTKYSHCSGCQIHRGFSLIYNSLKDDVRTAVQSLRKRHPKASVRLYGHSLGGALATLCAADLHVGLGITSEFIYTYGQPRVGNAAFATWYKSEKTITKAFFRVTHGADVVPHLPVANSGYYHTGTEVHYQGPGSKSGYKVCDGSGEDKNCARGIPFLHTNAQAHKIYMDSPGGCDNRNPKISALASEISSVKLRDPVAMEK